MGFRNTDYNKNIDSSDRISYDSSSYAFVDVEVEDSACEESIEEKPYMLFRIGIKD